MALEHAILVALSEKPGSGYELARRFDRSFGYFWSATHQQIYKVLARMETQKWVTVTEVAQEGRPDKKVYAVSDTGRDALRAWLAEPSSPVFPRLELGVKIRAAAEGDTAAIVADLRGHRDAHAGRLEAYRQIEKHDFPAPDGLTGRALHQYLVLRGGLVAEQAAIEWLDEAITTLEKDASK